MASIVTVEEAIREEAHRRLEAVTATFKRSIRLIYAESLDRKGLPEALGTGTLIRVGNVSLMLTAAHVTRNIEHTSLHVGGGHELVPLGGTAFHSAALPGQLDDPVDMSAWLLEPSLIAELGDVSFLEADTFPIGTDFGRGALFGCLGYPTSKNKDVHAGNQTVKTKLWKYASHENDDGSSALRAGSNPNWHLFIQFDSKHSRDEDGNVVNSPNPTGVSGGPVVYLGNLGSGDTYAIGSRIRPMLAGILTTNPKNGDAMRATRIDKILEVLAKKGVIQRDAQRNRGNRE